MGGTALRGTGFSLFGCRRPGPDGSYIATEFFCILYVPLVPVKTMRVTPVPGQSRLPFIRKRFVRSIKQPIDLAQVASVYLAAITIIAYGLCFFEFVVPYLKAHSSLIDDGWLEFLAFLMWMSPPWYLVRSTGNHAINRASEDIQKLNTPKPIDK